ncbi:hypothetical protein GCM10028833_09600 [Glycomyces tarimensis]
MDKANKGRRIERLRKRTKMRKMTMKLSPAASLPGRLLGETRKPSTDSHCTDADAGERADRSRVGTDTAHRESVR